MELLQMLHNGKTKVHTCPHVHTLMGICATFEMPIITLNLFMFFSKNHTGNFLPAFTFWSEGWLQIKHSTVHKLFCMKMPPRHGQHLCLVVYLWLAVYDGGFVQQICECVHCPSENRLYFFPEIDDCMIQELYHLCSVYSKSPIHLINLPALLIHHTGL